MNVDALFPTTPARGTSYLCHLLRGQDALPWTKDPLINVGYLSYIVPGPSPNQGHPNVFTVAPLDTDPLRADPFLSHPLESTAKSIPVVDCDAQRPDSAVSHFACVPTPFPPFTAYLRAIFLTSALLTLSVN